MASSTLMTLLVKLGLDSTEFDAGVDKATNKAGGFGKVMGGIGKVAGAAMGVTVAAVGAVGGALASTIGPASDLSETVSKVGVVFGDWAEDVIHFGDSAATALGMSKNEALAAAGTYGNLFKAMGIGNEATTDMSIGLVQLAADLASFNNMNPTDVLNALRSGLSGETEPLKRLGVNLNQAVVEAKALELGLWDGKGAIDAAAKAQATYALVMEQTSLAQGDFARTAGGLANQQRILKAHFENIKATIGTGLLPLITPLVSGFNDLLGGIQGIVASSDPMYQKMDKIGKLLGDFVASLAKQIPEMLTLGTQLIGSLVSGLVAALPGMMPSLVTMMMSVVNMILNLAPMMLDAGFQMLITLALGIAQALPTLIPTIVQMMMMMIQIIVLNLPLLLEAGIQIILGLIEGIINALPMLIERLPMIVMSIVQAIIDNLPLLLEAAVKIILALVQGIAMNLPQLLVMAVNLVVDLVAAIIGALPMVLEAGKQMLLGLEKGIMEMRPAIIESAKNVMDGFWEGLKSKFGQIWQGIKDFGKSIVDLLKGLFNIHSPSRVMFDIGKNLMLGLDEGIAKFAPQPELALRGSFSGIANTPSLATAEAGTGYGESQIDWYRVANIIADAVNRNSR